MENEGKGMTILGMLLIAGGVLLSVLLISSFLRQHKPGVSDSPTGANGTAN